MIHADDILETIIKEHNWEIMEVVPIGLLRTMFCIRRSNPGSKIVKLNVIVKHHNVKILNALKERDYIEADVSLFDPNSLDEIVNILQ